MSPENIGKPYIEITVNTQAPKHTNICVLNPAYLFVISRSNPKTKPKAIADKIRTASSKLAAFIIFSILF